MKMGQFGILFIVWPSADQAPPGTPRSQSGFQLQAARFSSLPKAVMQTRLNTTAAAWDKVPGPDLMFYQLSLGRRMSRLELTQQPCKKLTRALRALHVSPFALRQGAAGLWRAPQTGGSAAGQREEAGG